MPSLVSDNFRVFAAEQFMESLEEPLDSSGNPLSDSSTEALRDRSKIYIFIGRSQTWNSERYAGLGFNDIDTIPAPTDSFDELSEIYDDMIAMKRITRSDVNQVIRKRTWKTNTRYDMYKHNYSTGNQSATGANKLYDSQFYVMNSDFNVYKCIYNGETPSNPNGVISTVEPTGTSTSIFTTSDTYRWKYMYTLGINDFVKFVSSDFMPVKTDANVVSAAVSGAIDQAVVRNTGTGLTPGTYFSPIIGDYSTLGVVTFTVSNTAPIAQQIDPSTVSLAVVGEGYTFGTINLTECYTTLAAAQARTGTTTDLSLGSAGIDAIISPPDGHGSNVVRELGAFRVMINKAVEFLDGAGDVPTDMQFRRFGLISDPQTPSNSDLTFNTAAVCKAIKFEASASVNYTIGEVITQATTGAKGKVIHWDSVNKILRYFQNEYTAVDQSGNNQYKLVEFSGANAITGSQSGTSLIPDTVNGTGTVAGRDFNAGYSGSEVKKFSGSILYIENRKTIIRSDDQIEDIKLVIEF